MLYHLSHNKLYLIGAHQRSPDVDTIILGDKENMMSVINGGKKIINFPLNTFPQETNYEFQTEVH